VRTAQRKTIFVSSVQKELQAERRAIKDFVRNDPLLRRFFDVFLFEDLPAQDRRADAIYLHEVGQCDVYVGLFGNEYGFESVDGFSPTEREFDEATANGKPRFIFVKGANDNERHPKMLKLVGCSRRTAARDLDDMLDKGIIQRQGAGRSAYYVRSRNRAIC